MAEDAVGVGGTVTHAISPPPDPMYSSTFIFAKGQYDDEFHRLDEIIADAAKATQHPTHLQAKARYGEWLTGYQVVISQVLRSYGDSRLNGLLPLAKTESPTGVAAGEAIATWIAAFNDNDVDRIAALYDEQAVLWGTLSPEVINSAPGVRLYFERAFHGSGDTLHMVLQASQVRLFGDVAVNTGSYALHIRNDGRSQVLPARFSFVYRRVQDRWLIVDHHSSLLPAAPVAPGR